jgi:S-adenosylmethionine:tRNA ribosyltransferase-isomerase
MTGAGELEPLDIEAYNYSLPPELIAQSPLPRRDDSRLMRVFRSGGAIEHSSFAKLPSLLREGDLLVLNDTRVFRARVPGKKIPGGASAEIFFLSPAEGANEWVVLVRPGRKLPPGSAVETERGDVIRIGERLDDGRRIASIQARGADDFFARCGRVPLPPYIKNTAVPEERYQTVYADPLKDRSAAAPTAGLHFTPRLLEELRRGGTDIEFLTLDVGIGTFRPVKTKNIGEHRMHSEKCEISERCAESVNRAKSLRRRIVAVGTTVVRALESFADERGVISPGRKETDLFIKPGYRFKIPDAMITNFHLPKSTLLILTAAFAGYENILSAYAEAVKARYRFFSFGDAMLIE